VALKRVALLALVPLAAASAEAVPREGEGSIAITAGVRSPINGSFLDEARSDGENVQGGDFGVAPLADVTFSYWATDNFLLSVEGGYTWDRVSVSGANPWTAQQENLMLALRWVPWGGRDFWPYVGGDFGYSLNQLNGTALPHSEEADGYGGGVFLGAGWDLTAHFGVMGELR
jgi:hypothetical protein